MPINRKTRGEVVNEDSPNRGPVKALLGRELAPQFMWVHEIELRDGTRLHAYRHHHTQAVIRIARDGRCFSEEGSYQPSYRQITQYAAICEAFRAWSIDEADWLTPRERAALVFTRDHASYGLLEPGASSPLMGGCPADNGENTDSRYDDWYCPPEVSGHLAPWRADARDDAPF